MLYRLPSMKRVLVMQGLYALEQCATRACRDSLAGDIALGPCNAVCFPPPTVRAVVLLPHHRVEHIVWRYEL